MRTVLRHWLVSSRGEILVIERRQYWEVRGIQWRQGDQSASMKGSGLYCTKAAEFDRYT